MIKAAKLDKSAVIEILSKSFEYNKSVGFIVGDDIRRMQRIRALMEYSFLTCLDFGEVWLSECRTCCALILFPEWKRVTLKAILRDIGLVFSVIGIRLFKVLKREKLISDCYTANETDSFQRQGNAIYLWFIGTSPGFQGQGKGTQMLNWLLSNASSKGKSFYLETSAEKNMPWYTKLGFRVYDQLHLGYTLYFLKN